MTYTKWVACWGNGTSITNQTEAGYAKDLTLRYPIIMCFSGCALRFRFTNFTGSEPVTLEASVARAAENSIAAGTSGKSFGKVIDPASARTITVDGRESFTLLPGTEVESDPIPFDITAGETVSVSIYLRDYTDLNAGVLTTGPRSRGYYAYGEYTNSPAFPVDRARNTGWFYFLNTVDILTEEKNHALILFGDSITAQSWPEYLSERLEREGIGDVSIIRRAVSGTRILRQYDCITYAAYGLKGQTRFPLEVNTAGASGVLIQHGINDIIHPVGTEENIFRPWSDLPKAEELIDGIRKIYAEPARALGLKVYGGTLLPIYGWRTYAPFREDLKNALNEWLRTNTELDGTVDFDRAVRDPEDPRRFAPGFDSGDHLHPSEAAYKAMAEAVPAEMLM